MAQHYIDPAEQAVGAASGLTMATGTATATIVDIGSGVKRLRISNASDATWRAIIAAAAGAGDAEIYLRYTVRTAGTPMDLLPGTHLTNATPTYYRGGVARDTSFSHYHVIQRYSGGTLTALAGATSVPVGATSPTPVAGDTLHVRFRAVGTLLKMRYWLNASAEPSTWQLEVTDSTLTTGDVFLSGFRGVSHDIQFIGVGTGGDSAPTEAVVGGSDPLDTVAGVVTGADGTTPEASASVRLVNLSDDTLTKVVTGVDGAYSFGSLTEGQKYQLTAIDSAGTLIASAIVTPEVAA